MTGKVSPDNIQEKSGNKNKRLGVFLLAVILIVTVTAVTFSIDDSTKEEGLIGSNSSSTPSASASPSISPSVSPTLAPTTAEPSTSPTPNPTANPTTSPTASPTTSPSVSPTFSPTPQPTVLQVMMTNRQFHSDAAASDSFAWSLSVSQDYLVSGAYQWESDNRGSAYVFARNQGGANNWGQLKKVMGSDTDGSDQFGYSVKIMGELMIIGAPTTGVIGSQVGSAYIFSKDSGGVDNWGQVKKLDPGDPSTGQDFGSQVSIDGTIAAVAALRESNVRGSVYVFHKDQGGAENWGQIKKLTLDTAVDYDEFGISLQVLGTHIFVGARGRTVNGVKSGAVYIYEKDQGGVDNWGLVKELVPDTPSSGAQFGFSLSASGDYLAVGALVKGRVYVFNRNEGGFNNWGTVAELAPGTSRASFGVRVSMTVANGANILLVSAYPTNSLTGAVDIFTEVSPGNWLWTADLMGNDITSGEWFGSSIGADSTTVIVGAMRDGTGGTLYTMDCQDEGAC